MPKKKPSKPRAPITWRSEEWPFTKFQGVKRAPWNPKQPTDEELSQVCESLRTFGIGRAFAVRDDGLFLDGHQFLSAIERLLAGEHTDPRTRRRVEWTPPATVPMRVGSGIDDATAKAFVVALARAKVEPDHELLRAVVVDVHAAVVANPEDDFFAQAFDAMALGEEEEADFLGIEPEPSTPLGKGTPKLTLEFTSAEMRDAVKREIESGRHDEKESSGAIAARLLGVKSKRRKRAEP